MLKNFVKGIADAIRRKEGSTDLISPMDFAQRIDNLQVGGGSTDESSIEYLDVSGKPLIEWGEIFGFTAFLVKMPTKIISVSLMIALGETVNDATAFAIDPTIEFDWQGSRTTIADFCSSMGVDLSTYPRITKEQFYDLTT